MLGGDIGGLAEVGGQVVELDGAVVEVLDQLPAPRADRAAEAVVAAWRAWVAAVQRNRIVCSVEDLTERPEVRR